MVHLLGKFSLNDAIRIEQSWELSNNCNYGVYHIFDQWGNPIGELVIEASDIQKLNEGIEYIEKVISEFGFVRIK